MSTVRESMLLLPKNSSILVVTSTLAGRRCDVPPHVAVLNKLSPSCADEGNWTTTTMMSGTAVRRRRILQLIPMIEDLRHLDPEDSGKGRRLAESSRARRLLRDLSRPTATCSGGGGKLVRHGAQGDGGYVLCSLLPIVGGDGGGNSRRPVSASSCLIYSFGIKDQYEFENQAVGRGCTVHGYDPTVPQRPNMRFHFHRLGLGDSTRLMPGVGPVSTLSKVMADNGHVGRRLALFKCDVEGAEWGALGQMSDAELGSFAHVIIELHLTGSAASKPRETDEQWMQRFAPTIARLRRHMDLYRAHANNCGGFRRVGGVMIPLVWELSFAQKGTLPPLPEQAPSHANAEADLLDKPICGTTAFTRQWVTADLECECKSADAASCSCKQRYIPFATPTAWPSLSLRTRSKASTRTPAGAERRAHHHREHARGDASWWRPWSRG